jgi:hypothetical protein
LKAFDPVVTLGFVFGNEQHFHPHKQAQAHYLPDDAPMRLAPANGGLVVELL